MANVTITEANLTPWSTAAQYAYRLPPGYTIADQQRLASYTVYEDFYWNQKFAFSQVQEGSNDDPIYLPLPMMLIEAINRYLAVDWNFTVDPAVGNGADRAAAQQAFTQLFMRENVQAKFISQKRYGLIRGDAFWHVVADPNKPAGRRISLYELDPASFFPIQDDEEDPDRLTGVYIVDGIDEYDGSDKAITYSRRQAYYKVPQPDGSVRISTETILFEFDEWDDREGQPTRQVRVISPETLLPTGISTIPVYQIKNRRNPADPFGSSALRGIERLFEAANQTISDEDLAVALAGLGVFVTDAGAPVDDNGDEVAWQISPGRVVELGTLGAQFQRVPGITSVQPTQDHLTYLEGKINGAAAVPAIALGDVDVASAQSGIALYLKMQPLLAANKERETEMLGIYDQMFFDLQTMWFPAYEQLNFPTALITATVGDPLPENVTQKIQDIVSLVNAKIMSAQTAQRILKPYGFDFAADEMDLITAETTTATAAADPFSQRMQSEQQSGSGAPAPADAGTTGGAS